MYRHVERRSSTLVAAGVAPLDGDARGRSAPREAASTLVRLVMTKEVTTVDSAMDLRRLSELLSEEHVGGLPVVESGRLVGVVSATDLVDFLASTPGVPESRPEAAEWGEADREPTLEPEPGDVGPFFVDYWMDAGADVLERFAETEGPEWDVLAEHTVSELMSRRLLAVGPNATLQDAAREMARWGVHRLLVVREERLEGLITSMDIVRAVAAEGTVVEPSGAAGA